MMCGWCFSVLDEDKRPVIISGAKDLQRCDYCGRFCYGYKVTEKRKVKLEDNERRPADFAKALPQI